MFLDDYNDKKLAEFYLPLVVNAPVKASIRYKENKLNIKRNKTDSVVRKLIKGLGIKEKDAFTFKYNSEAKDNNKKSDIKGKVLSSYNQKIIWQDGQGILMSLYCGVRNALAHGNICYKNGRVVLFAVKEEISVDVFSSMVTFYLEIKELDSLSAFVDIIMSV